LLSAWAIKCLDTGKLFAFALLCAPEARFMAGSFSHDSAITAYAVLAVGFLSLWLKKREADATSPSFSGRQIGYLIGAMILTTFVVAGRPPNFPLALLLSLWGWFGMKGRPHAAWLAVSMAILILLYPAIWILSVKSLATVNEFGSNNAGQIHFMLHHVGELPQLFFNTALHDSYNYLITLVGVMGSGPQNLPTWCFGVYGTGLLLCFLHEELFSARRFPWWIVGTGVSLLLGVFVVLNIYAYIYWTPLGNSLINGVGGRYFFPSLLFLGLLLGLRRVPWKAGYSALALVLVSLAALVLVNGAALFTVIDDYYFIR
jgi:uncharacterized membrane protein